MSKLSNSEDTGLKAGCMQLRSYIDCKYYKNVVLNVKLSFSVTLKLIVMTRSRQNIQLILKDEAILVRVYA